MDALIRAILADRAELDRLRTLAPHGLDNFERSRDIELTYTSTALEGNTLTAVETTLVVEHGLTVAGKPLRDHMEAIDHHAAIGWVRALARGARLTETDLRGLHREVMLRSAPEIAGRYADQGRLVLTATGRHAFPSPVEVAPLMAAFVGWLSVSADTPLVAFDAHRQLVAIHPFNDGNGRTARLLMNLVLLRGGWPAVEIRPEDRPAYVAALATAQDGDAAAFDLLLHERLAAALAESVAALRQAVPR